MYKLHQIEKLNFWLNADGSRCCYSLTYNERSNILHVFNHAYPKTYSLYTGLSQNSDDFICKIRNQMKFAMSSEVPANTRIFFYDRSQIVYEWSSLEGKIKPLVEEEWYLLYTAYLKPLPKTSKYSRGCVVSE